VWKCRWKNIGVVDLPLNMTAASLRRQGLNIHILGLITSTIGVNLLNPEGDYKGLAARPGWQRLLAAQQAGPRGISALVRRLYPSITG
jgi:hypothetical protein